MLQVDEIYDEPLREIIAKVNQLDKLRIKVPSMDGGEPEGIKFQDVARGDPELTEAILRFLDQKYNLRLEPVQPT